MKTYTVKLSELDMNALIFGMSMAVDVALDGFRNSLETGSDHIISSWKETHREMEKIYYRISLIEPDGEGAEA